MITESKKLIKKLILSILIVFSGFINTAYAALYVTDKDFEKIVKTEDFLKIIARNEGEYEAYSYLCLYIVNSEKIRHDCIDKKFGVFAFSSDFYSNIARNIAWDIFKEKSIYFFKDLWELKFDIKDSKQINLDSADNVERSIFFIKDTVFQVYNNYLLRIGKKPVENLSSEDLDYICTEVCRMCYCYAMDFAAYINYFYLFENL